MKKAPQARLAEITTRVETRGPGAAREQLTYVDIGAINADTKTIVGPRCIESRLAPSRARQILQRGDVLVSTVRPNLNAVAQVPAHLDGAIGSTGFCVLRADPKQLDTRYIFHWVRTPSFVSAMVSRATGAGYPAISDRTVLDSRIPLPNLSEQRLIAEVLDRADALRASRRSALNAVMALPRSIFLHSFGDPIRNPRHWRMTSLGTQAYFIGGGTPARDHPEYYAGPICWATSKDMKHEFLDDTEEHITPKALAHSAAKLVGPGAILVVVKSKVLARHLPVALTRVPACFGQDLKAIQVGDNCRPEFLAEVLRTGAGWLLSRARGINTEGLTLEHLRSFPLILPPLDVQQEFASHIASIENVRVRNMASLKEADALFASLQYRAFRGEL